MKNERQKRKHCALLAMLFVAAGMRLAGEATSNALSETCIHSGDVTGDAEISAADAQRAFLIAIGAYLPTQQELCAADCNGDGAVSAGDAQSIFAAAIGLGTCLDPLDPPTPVATATALGIPSPSPAASPGWHWTPSPAPSSGSPTPPATVTASYCPTMSIPTPTGGLAGTVTDPAESPLELISVKLFNSSFILHGQTVTHADGSYGFFGLSTGSYYLEFDGTAAGETGYCSIYYPDASSRSEAQLIHLDEPLTVTLAPVELPPAGAIGGQIRFENGAPGAGVRVFVIEQDAQMLPPESASTSVPTDGWFARGAAMTDSAGGFLITGLSPGDNYYLYAKNDEQRLEAQWFDGKATRTELSDTDRITVQAGMLTAGLDLELPNTGAIAGAVVCDGRPIAGVSVRAYAQAAGSWVWTGVAARSAETLAPTGTNYLLAGLPAGTYLVKAIGSFVACETLFYGGATTEEDAAAVTVEPLQTTLEVDFTLRPTGSISGRVVSPEGYDGVIRLFAWRDPERQDVACQKTVHLTERGLFRFDRIPTGEYYLGAYLDDGTGIICEPPFDPWAALPAGFLPLPVTVSAGEESGDLELFLTIPELSLPAALSGRSSPTPPPDTLAPVLQLETVPSLSRDCCIAIGGTVSEDALIEISGEAPTIRSYTSPVYPHRFSVNAWLEANQTTTLTVRARDAAGNYSSPETIVIRHDSIAPLPPSGISTADRGNGSFAIFGCVGATESEAWITVEALAERRRERTSLVTLQAGVDGSFTAELPASFGQRLLFTAEDEAGNVGPTLELAAGSAVELLPLQVWVVELENETALHREAYRCGYSYAVPPYYEFEEYWGWSAADAAVAGRQEAVLIGYEGSPMFVGAADGNNLLLTNRSSEKYQYQSIHQYPLPPIINCELNSVCYSELSSHTHTPVLGITLDDNASLLPAFLYGLNITRSCSPSDDCHWELAHELHALALLAAPPDGPFLPAFETDDGLVTDFAWREERLEPYDDCPFRRGYGGRSGRSVASKVSVGDGDVFKVNILKPKGSAAAAKNPRSSFLTNGPYRFDFQWVQTGTPGYYENDIEAKNIPERVLHRHRPEIDYHWDVSGGEFDPDDGDDPRKLKGQRCVGYRATEAVETVELNLFVRESDRLGEQTRILEVFPDHLARDFANFGAGGNCRAENGMPWWFNSHGASIPMTATWNCHGSVIHAYNGSGNGYSETATVRWNPIVHLPPIDWDMIESLLERGDVVSFWSGTPSGGFVLEHSHTCLGSAVNMYGANNEPFFNFRNNPPLHPATWKWFICSSREYFESINDAYREVFQTDLITKVEFDKMPYQQRKEP